MPLTRMRPKAVIFDCDGVVVDSEPLAFALLAQDLSAHGFVISQAEMEAELLGRTMTGVHARAVELGARLPDTWVAAFYAKLYAELARGVALIPGILALLDTLDAAGIPYAIGSNGSPEKIGISLGHYPGLQARFKGGVFSGQMMPQPKPAPDLYLHAANAMQVAPADCVVVEDSPTGARAALAAGMRCFGLAPHGHAELAAAGATVIPRLDDLPALWGL
jgi:HAD superfamily hydrolase (TIGR01509 family)